MKEEEDARGGTLGHRSANSLNGCRVSLPSQLCCVSLSVLLLLPCPSHNNWQEIALISPPRLLLDEKSFNGNMNIQKMRYIHLCICIYMQLVLIFSYGPLFHLHVPHYSLPVNPGSRSSTALNLNPPQWVCTSGLQPHSSGRGGLGPPSSPIVRIHKWASAPIPADIVLLRATSSSVHSSCTDYPDPPSSKPVVIEMMCIALL